MLPLIVFKTIDYPEHGKSFEPIGLFNSAHIDGFAPTLKGGQISHPFFGCNIIAGRKHGWYPFLTPGIYHYMSADKIESFDDSGCRNLSLDLFPK